MDLLASANSNFWKKFLPLLIGSTVGLLTLNQLLKISIAEVDFAKLGLGAETSTYFAFEDGRKVHCQDLSNSEICLGPYRESSKEPVFLWLGNSQQHGINQMKKGDKTAASHLFKRFRNEGKYFITFSQSNANLQEHYVMFEYLLTQLPITQLILPLVFDDLRETGVRHTIASAYQNGPVKAQLEKTSIGRGILSAYPAVSDSGDADLDRDISGLDNTVQKKAEQYLNAKLAASSRLWEQRPKLRDEVLFSLYAFRNWIFRIDARSLRKAIPGRYAANMEALEATLARAKEANVSVLLYIPPLRNDVQIPYDKDQYSAFKMRVQQIAANEKVKFADFETIVPADYWGTKASTSLDGGKDLDFMHFQAKGHEILGDAIARELSQTPKWGKNF